MNNDHKTTILGALGALLVGLRDGLDFNKLSHLDAAEVSKLGSMVVMILWGWFTNKSQQTAAEKAQGAAAG